MKQKNLEQFYIKLLDKTEKILEYSKDKISKSVIEKAKNYIEDSKYFSKQDIQTAILALEYAYGLIEGALMQANFDPPIF